jgi:hypothetical protein
MDIKKLDGRAWTGVIGTNGALVKKGMDDRVQ